jgi:hypothetical protein
MARLIKREALGKAPVYDVTVWGTHCFFASSGESQTPILAHNCHQLSRDALDALLKPLEDTQGSSENRKLVCIFCTTEPEKMRETIGSRCGPTFAVHTVPPEKTVERLAWICEQENASFEKAALLRVAESVEGHIRDAFKACEMLSLQGGITLQNVELFLGQDLNTLYLDLLEGVSVGKPQIEVLDKLLVRVSPAGVYEKLAKVCLLAYKVGCGLGKAPSYWDTTRLRKLHQSLGGFLLDLTDLFSTRPRRPTKEMLQCDFLSMQKKFSVGAIIAVPAIGGVPLTSEAPPVFVPQTVESKLEPRVEIRTSPVPQTVPQMTQEGGYLTVAGVYNPPWGESEGRRKAMQVDPAKATKNPSSPSQDSEVDMRSAQFCTLVRTFTAELRSKKAQTLGQATTPDS